MSMTERRGGSDEDIIITTLVCELLLLLFAAMSLPVQPTSCSMKRARSSRRRPKGGVRGWGELIASQSLWNGARLNALSKGAQLQAWLWASNHSRSQRSRLNIASCSLCPQAELCSICFDNIMGLLFGNGHRWGGSGASSSFPLWAFSHRKFPFSCFYLHVIQTFRYPYLFCQCMWLFYSHHGDWLIACCTVFCIIQEPWILGLWKTLV